VVGASGTIGEAIVDNLQQETDYQIVAVSSRSFQTDDEQKTKRIQIELLDFKNLRKAILEEKPDFIINAAGISDEEFCKHNKKIAWAVNVELVSNLSSISKILDSFFITFSCDSVFDSNSGPYSENAKPNPINYLGKTKLAAENTVQTTLQKYTIIRLPLVYGISLKGSLNWFTKLLQDVQNGQTVTLPKNLYTNPVFSEDVAWGTLKAIERQYVGILHFGGNSYFSLFEFGRKVTEVFKLPSNLLQPTRLPSKEQHGLEKAFAESLLDIKFSTNYEGLIALHYLMNGDRSPFDKLFQL
jgi:dTDP-4-dehydrorhamnose reductase